MSYIVVSPLSLLNVLQDHLHRSSTETLTTSIPEQLSPCWTRAHSYDSFGATAHGTAQDMLAPLGSSALLGAVDGWGLLGLTQSASGSQEGGITALLPYFYYYPIFQVPSWFWVISPSILSLWCFSCLRPVMSVESLCSFTSCMYLVCQFSFISHLSILLCHVSRSLKWCFFKSSCFRFLCSCCPLLRSSWVFACLHLGPPGHSTKSASPWLWQWLLKNITKCVVYLNGDGDWGGIEVFLHHVGDSLSGGEQICQLIWPKIPKTLNWSEWAHQHIWAALLRNYHAADMVGKSESTEIRKSVSSAILWPKLMFFIQQSKSESFLLK